MNENVEEWMGRLRLAAVQCNYKEVDRQLKEQFIQRLNDNDMLGEIIRKLTKAEECTAVTTKHVLVWTKRVDGQRAKFTIITILSKQRSLTRKIQ